MTPTLALIDGDFSLNFLRGVLSAVNPCGFALLPTYLMFFLGLEGARPGSQRAGIARALKVSACLSGGFLAVFLVIGTLYQAGFRWFTDHASWLSIVIGGGMIVLGIAMLFGFRIKVNTARIDAGGRDQTALQMFLYGVSYALASIGCTIAFFIPAIASVSQKGVMSGVLVTSTYALGMALVITALTVALATARTALLSWLRAAMRYLDPIAAVLLILTGAYLILYGRVGLTNDRNGVVTRLENIQSDIANWLGQRSVLQLVAALGGVVAAAVAFVLLRRDQDDAAPEAG